MNRVILGVVLIAIGLGMFVVFAGNQGRPVHENAMRKAGEAALRRQVARPNSVKFGDEWVGKDKHTDVLCGYYNRKDKSGAYIGQKRFIVSGNVALADKKSAPVMDRMWANSCEPFRHEH